jgi:tripartite-type tricarboxylate transporter receptor subunit TctC
MPYSLDDFAPITLVSRIPLTLDTYAKFPAKDVKQLIAYAKTKPDGVTIATAGAGSVGEVVNTMTEHMVGIHVTSVPYRGGAPAAADLMKGVIDLFYNNISTAVPLYGGGMIRPLAITGRQRSPLIPNVPTMIELGYKDFVMENVVTVLAPKDTPRPLIDKLNALFRRAMDDSEVKQTLLSQGVVPEGSTPEATREIIKADAAFVARIAKEFDIKKID